MSSGTIYNPGLGPTIELCTAVNADDAYERGRAAGRAEERADIVAWMRDVADELVATSDGNGGVAIGAKTLRIHADQIEARAKAPAERQDARDGQEGTRAGSDTISRAGGVFP